MRLRDTGKVVTYSVSYVNADASRRKGEAPILVAVVEIEGASPLMGILHILGEVAPDERRRRHEGRSGLEAEESRGEGAITDIRYFRPLPSGAGKR